MKIFSKLFLTILLIAFAAASVDAKVVGSVKLKSGETSNKRMSTVNGSVKIGENCVLNASASTVNGSIYVGNDSRTGKLSTVNGRIKVGSNCRISGKLSTVNGSITCEAKTVADGSVTTVNGSIKLNGSTADTKVSTVNGSISLNEATVSGNMSTVNGTIVLKNGSVLEGNLYIGKSGSSWFKRLFSSSKKKPLKIYVTGNSKINGDIVVRKQEREILLILSDGGKVKGDTEGVKIIKE